MKQILFIHGAGEGAYQADSLLAKNMQDNLGSEYKVTYPAMVNEADPVYAEWRRQIEETLSAIQEPVFFVGHSIGGSVLMKFLSEVESKDQIAGVFIIAAPFWGGGGWLYEGYKDLVVLSDAAKRLKGIPVYLYHCRDDEVVPYEHLLLFKSLIPNALEYFQNTGGHQFGNDLSQVANDIKNLK